MKKPKIQLSILSSDELLISLYRDYFAPQIQTKKLGSVIDFKADFILVDLNSNHYQAMDLIWQFRRFKNPHSKIILLDYLSAMSDTTINMLITHYGLNNYFFKNHTTVSTIKQYMVDNL
jgi:response regulator RpfG family c-di-GMP phosphodiesterase